MRHVSGAAQKRTQQGFSLIELMVVVAILAIIAVVAIPSYRNHVVRSNRANAESFMHQVASKQEQIMLDMRSYQAVAATANFGNPPGAGATAGLNLPAPANVVTNYTITVTVTAGPPPTYLITATPNNPPQNDLLCTTLTLDNTGAKGATPAANSQLCWQ